MFCVKGYGGIWEYCGLYYLRILKLIFVCNSINVGINVNFYLEFIFWGVLYNVKQQKNLNCFKKYYDDFKFQEEEIKEDKSL